MTEIEESSAGLALKKSNESATERVSSRKTELKNGR